MLSLWSLFTNISAQAVNQTPLGMPPLSVYPGSWETPGHPRSEAVPTHSELALWVLMWVQTFVFVCVFYSAASIKWLVRCPGTMKDTG